MEEKPELTPLYAEYLASTEEIDRSLELMQTHAADAPFPVLERTTRSLMKNRYVTPEQLVRIQDILKSYRCKPDELVSLTLLRADLASWQGDATTSAELFRKILSDNSKNVIALNNLAVVLALYNSSNAEALKSIEDAIKIGGPMDALYDTRGMVYLSADKLEIAAAEFERALMENDNSERRFHAAVAYARMSAINAETADKNLRAAKKSLARAEDFGLYEMDLHPVERQTLKELRIQLAMPVRQK